MASPNPQQQRQQQYQQVPPEYKIPEPEQPTPQNPIDYDNAKFIENWLNGLKPGYYEYLAKQYQKDPARAAAATSQYYFTQGFFQYLSMYRTGLAGFYLNETSQQMIFAALGPIGDIWRKYCGWDMQRKVNWMKNPLNPNAVYYYFNSLPTEMAFKVGFIPFKAAWGILARGGAPFTTKAVYQYTERNIFSKDYGKSYLKEGYFFSPTLKATQAADNWANQLDESTELPTTPEGELKYLENTHKQFSETLLELKNAKNRNEIKSARQNLKHLLNEHDGKGILQPLKKSFGKNLSRRLRRFSEDPITGLLAILTGFIWDLSAGLALNIVKTVINKIVNAIPGVNTLRAQSINFFSDSKVFNTARIGGATVGSFGRALISPTSLSSGYIGAGAGGWLANALGLPVFQGQIIGGGIGYGLGVFYKTSLNMALNRYGLYLNKAGQGWVQQYQTFKADEALGEKMIQEKYYQPLKPGPFSNFAKFLYNHPWFRIPVNGWVIGDLAAKAFGWNPWVGRISFAAADWAWQTRTWWAQSFINWFPTTPIGQWVIKTGLSLQARFINPIFYGTEAEVGATQWTLRPFWQKAQNFWGKAQPYATNVFNPGFWLGMTLTPALTPFIGGWAYLAGPAVGSVTWLAGTRIIASTLGYQSTAAFGAFISRFNALSYAGLIISQLTGFAFFGLNIPIWYTLAWTLGLPMGGVLLQTLAWSLGYSTMSAFLGSILSTISGGLISIVTGTSIFATATAVWAAAMSIGLIAGCTIFFAYTVYAGFWVPVMEEARANPESSNFSINSNCAEIGPNQYNCCSNFSVTANVFSQEKYLSHKFDFRTNYLTVDLSDPRQTVTASRGQSLNYASYNPSNITSDQFMIPPPGDSPPIVGYAQQEQLLETYLSAPNTQPQNMRQLMQADSSFLYSLSPYFDMLKNMADEYKSCSSNPKIPCTHTSPTIDQYNAQLSLLKKQKNLVNDLVPLVRSGSLPLAITTAAKYDPCPDPAQVCPEDQAQLNSLVDGYQNILKAYSTQTNPNLENYLTSLQTEADNLQAQIDQIPDIVKQLESIQGNLTASNIQEINNTNFLSFAQMDQAEQNAAFKLLQSFFPSIFVDSNTFYYIPQGTHYQVCTLVNYCQAIDPANPPSCPTGQPISLCSTISYTPLGGFVFSNNTAFAKSCTTFTP